MSKQVLTMKGYDLFECVSAFQKEIRRGNEMNAMYWGVELYESGFTAYAWKRMIIISIEDIGIINPAAPLIVSNLKQLYEEMVKADDKKQQYRLPYVQAILYLVRSKKSRHTDWALNYYFDSHLFDDNRLEIPEYALDIHTRRGKIKGKTINDFFDEGSVLNNNVELPYEDFYKEECRKRWNDKEWIRKSNLEKARRKDIKEQKAKAKAQRASLKNESKKIEESQENTQKNKTLFD